MIRPLEERDYTAAIRIVNKSWRAVYAGYVNPTLLDDDGCRARGFGLSKR